MSFVSLVLHLSSVVRSLMAVQRLLLFLLLGPASCFAQQMPTAEPISSHDAVEYLIFRVDPDRVDEFIRLENEVWTHGLRQQTGFISKDIWVNESKPSEVSVIIHWKDFDSWKNIPKEVSDQLTQQFDERFGADDYQLIREVHGGNRLVRVSHTEKRE